MKTSILSALLLVFSLAVAYAEPPKSGQSLGTITTSDGKTYVNAKLAVIEPDGISILYADGGAKIPFTSLSPELQVQFGYTADKSAAYAHEQALLAQIDTLQQENAALRKRLNLGTVTPGQQPSLAPSSSPKGASAISRKAYLYFYNDLVNQSGALMAISDARYPIRKVLSVVKRKVKERPSPRSNGSY